MKNSLLLLISILALSCSKKENISAVDSFEQQVLKEIRNQPDITADAIEQHNFKEMNVEGQYTSGMTTNFKYKLVYNSDGKISSVSTAGKEFLSFEYVGNHLNLKSEAIEKKYELDVNGLATKSSLNAKYYYKNGFLIRDTGEFSSKNLYSPNGNLVLRETSEGKIYYEYTDFKNTIRQEIVRGEAIHWTFRDSYLGRFSTNLLKKVQFADNFNTILEYSYEFDDKSRVKTMIIKRSRNSFQDAVFKYNFVY